MIEKTCPHCGKVFQTNSKRKKFCCPRCADNYYSVIQWKKKKAMNPHRKVGRQPKSRICPVCGKEFYNRDRKYCSDECLDDATFLKNIDQNRPFTHDTVWLVKKWYCEGESVHSLSRILGRPESVIEGIIGGEYDEYEREAIENPILEGKIEDDCDVQEWA